MTDTTATVHQAVTIDVPAAALLVTASDRADVDVTIEPSNPDRSADREAAERITVTETENGIAVTGEKRLLLGANGSADVRLAVPAGTDLEATISAGAVRLRGHLGAVRLKISAGDVTGDTMVSIRAKVSHGSIALAEVADGADLQLSSGEAEIGRIGGGETRIKSGHGSIRIDDFAGSAELITATGGIALGEVDGDVSATSGHGTVRVSRARGGRLELGSNFGGIDVAVAPGAPVWIDADSKRGVVRTDLESDAGPLGDEKPVEVHAHTKFGDIAIDRAR
ncbi:DUF4097 domain-containing protein [Brevibacterium casei]|nr:DUF4097 family beta strand repeat-containing protein [Brevibacterium casei]KZE17175.1 hypothetical protein AVW13_13865 [Brevibacterium casei]MBE4696051.1 DUF4097 family beta strand repeat protein [Brevibacterium casei]MBY3579173.1 DUF4097 domain-containing protein [Brevibacterium casei]MCT2358636.1 DUF4097 domain-containing protein [Brevibacterium casei]QQT69651.1 DUF4097 family beta strand repeat protein [Brevibacterium casei]